MMLPDKIYISIERTYGASDGQIIAMVTPHNERKSVNDTEYIRKDALLEWLENKIKVPGKEMTDKEKIRAEIERLKEAPYLTEEHALIGYDCALSDVLSIIDSIPDHFADVSKKGEAPKGYDEAYLNECIAKASKTWKGVDVDKLMDEVRGRESDDLEEAAEEYASINCDNYVDYDCNICYIEEGMRVAFKAGAEWQKRKMMKDAVEGEITKDINNMLHVKSNVLPMPTKHRFGDKVKIKIIKDYGYDK